MIRAVKAGEWTAEPDGTVTAAGITLQPGEFTERLVAVDAERTAALPGNTGPGAAGHGGDPGAGRRGHGARRRPRGAAGAPRRGARRVRPHHAHPGRPGRGAATRSARTRRSWRARCWPRPSRTAPVPRRRPRRGDGPRRRVDPGRGAGDRRPGASRGYGRCAPRRGRKALGGPRGPYSSSQCRPVPSGANAAVLAIARGVGLDGGRQLSGAAVGDSDPTATTAARHRSGGTCEVTAARQRGGPSCSPGAASRRRSGPASTGTRGTTSRRGSLPPPVPADTPSRAAGLALLAPPGACSTWAAAAGDAAFALAERATELIGVDRQRDMLDVFAATARERGLPARVVLGEWPDAATDARAGRTSVVANHVLHNVVDLPPFLRALTAGRPPRRRRRDARPTPDGLARPAVGALPRPPPTAARHGRRRRRRAPRDGRRAAVTRWERTTPPRQDPAWVDATAVPAAGAGARGRRRARRPHPPAHRRHPHLAALTRPPTRHSLHPPLPPGPPLPRARAGRGRRSVRERPTRRVDMRTRRGETRDSPWRKRRTRRDETRDSPCGTRDSPGGMGAARSLGWGMPSLEILLGIAAAVVLLGVARGPGVRPARPALAAALPRHRDRAGRVGAGHPVLRRRSSPSRSGSPRSSSSSPRAASPPAGARCGPRSGSVSRSPRCRCWSASGSSGPACTSLLRPGVAHGPAVGRRAVLDRRRRGLQRAARRRGQQAALRRAGAGVRHERRAGRARRRAALLRRAVHLAHARPGRLRAGRGRGDRRAARLRRGVGAAPGRAALDRPVPAGRDRRLRARLHGRASSRTPPGCSPPTSPRSSSATPTCRTAAACARSPRAPAGSPRSACSCCSGCTRRRRGWSTAVRARAGRGRRCCCWPPARCP